MAAEGYRTENHAALLNAVWQGVILLFNGCNGGIETGKIKKLYKEAAR
jgi:hypothetical protein